MARLADAACVGVLAHRSAGCEAPPIVKERRGRCTLQALAGARAITGAATGIASNAGICRGGAPTCAREPIFDCHAIAAATIQADGVAVIADLRANSLAIAAYGSARVTTREGASRARKPRLNLASGATAITCHGVVVVTLLGGAPENANAIPTYRSTRVQPSDTRTFGTGRGARPARFYAAESVAAVSARRVVVVADLGRRALRRRVAIRRPLG